MIFRLILITVLAIAIYGTIQHLKSSVQLHQVNALMVAVQKNTSNEFQKLLDGTKSLESESLLKGRFTKLIARSKSLVYSKPGSGFLVNEDSLKESYKTALNYSRYDSFLWAKLALHYSRLEGVSPKMLYALDSAVRYGKNDYQTLRILVSIAIRDWPKFNCHRKEEMLSVVESGLTVDDLILNQWMIDHGHMRIGRYLSRLFKNYDFDPKWAKIQVNVCKQKQFDESV